MALISGKSKVEVLPTIQGDVLKQARERARLSEVDLANKLCLSKKSIIQLEEGGSSTFFSESHKISVAKRVIAILKLEENQVLIYPDQSNAIQATLPLEQQPVDEQPPVVSSKRHVLKAHEEPKVSLDDLDSTISKERQERMVRVKKNAVSIALAVLVGAGLFTTKDAILDLVTPAPKPAPVEVKTEEQLAAEAAAAQAAQLALEPSCPNIQGVTIPEFRAIEPSKSGDFVFVQAKSKQTVCVTDATGKTTLQTIEAGANFNFTGKPPLTLYGADLSEVAAFYQGKPVRLVKTQVAVKLVEVKQTSAPTSSSN